MDFDEMMKMMGIELYPYQKQMLELMKDKDFKYIIECPPRNYAKVWMQRNYLANMVINSIKAGKPMTIGHKNEEDAKKTFDFLVDYITSYAKNMKELGKVDK